MSDVAASSDQHLPLMMETRKFKAVILAMLTFGTPVVLTFVLVFAKQATIADAKEMAKWMGLAMSPVFVGYIGAVAYEDAAKKRGPTTVNAPSANLVESSKA